MRKLILLAILIACVITVSLGQTQNNNTDKHKSEQSMKVDPTTENKSSSEESVQINAETVVQKQYDAHNRGDLETFLSTWSSDLKVYLYPNNLFSTGIEPLRMRYSKLFETAKNLKATVTKRIVQGNYVIDHEIVTGMPGGKEIEGVAIYEVKDGKIINLWLMK
jgi:hypothetical protein